MVISPRTHTFQKSTGAEGPGVSVATAVLPATAQVEAEKGGLQRGVWGEERAT